MRERSERMDWKIACIVAAYGAVCWLAGWHGSISASGKMYDEGYRAGYSAGRELDKINQMDLDRKSRS